MIDHLRARRARPTLLCVGLVVSLLAGACSSDSDAGSDEPDVTTTTAGATTGPGDPGAVERVPGDDWTVEPPADHGMDAALLEEARRYAFADGRNTQGVVVVHQGAIVAEWYSEGADEESWAASWSVAKSFTSALVGIAIDEGKIPSVDEPMTTWYPEWADRGLGEVTLEDILHMAPGIEWNENYSPTATGTSDIIRMVLAEQDQLAYAASREPSGDEPGTVFNYSSGTTMLVSGVIEQATGMRADEYAKEKLFDPISAEKAEWWLDADDTTLTYCCLDTTSRGFARFGLLYLREGRWGDQQVVPESWVADSVEGSPAVPDLYGYQWWLNDFEGVPNDLFMANGHDGQYIYVIPSLDLVVVRNGTYAKFDGPPVADPILFDKYPSDNLSPGHGTAPPDEWDAAQFLGPIVDSLGD